MIAFILSSCPCLPLCHFLCDLMSFLRVISLSVGEEGLQAHGHLISGCTALKDKKTSKQENLLPHQSLAACKSSGGGGAS